MRNIIAILLLVLTASAYAEVRTRHTIIISDLHFGVGRETGGQEWLAPEDFRWTSEWDGFLTKISAETGNNVDLIIAGDMFELWQPLDKGDCEHPNRNYGCSESEAEKRVQRVLKEHAVHITRLGAFASEGSNRVVIVPGNHDAALFFPAVRKRVLDAFGSAAARVSIAVDGHWLSMPDKTILVEHGQQMGRDVNRFDRWPDPFLGPQGAQHLQKTWGEQFVQSFYNQYEEKYPVIDNISDNGGIGYGLKAERLPGIGMAIGKFLRFYFGGSSWGQFAQSLGDKNGKAPEWDIARIRAEGDVFFYESISTTDPMRAVAERAYAEGMLGISLSDLEDAEIRTICDSRAVLNDAQVDKNQPVTIERCHDRAAMGAITQALFGPARDRLVKNRALDLYKQLREKLVVTRPFDLYVYGHTHSAYNQHDIEVDQDWTVRVANTGAWQRIASPEQFKQLECRGTSAEVLRTSLLRLPACYPVVHVKPFDGKPKAELRYWTESGGSWSLTSSCNWKAPDCPTT